MRDPSRRRGAWAAKLCWLGLGALAASACDEAIPFPWERRGSPDGSDTATPAEIIVTGPCKVADEVFTPYCVECHDGAQRYPDLRAGALGRLAGAPAQAYTGRLLVVANDPTTSLLLQKMHRGVSGVGALMPPDGELSSALIDTVSAWIAEGAPACSGVEDPGPSDPVVPEPGGTITFGSPPSGFVTTHPSWAAAGTCTAQQWWSYQGNHESSNMHPGVACIACHTREREGPVLSYAGTVYPDIADSDDCRGVSGVKVDILDLDGNVVGTTTTRSSGNFYWEVDDLGFRPSYRARLSFEGRTREMTLPQSTTGDCNTCHSATGTDGSPGRMVVP